MSKLVATIGQKKKIALVAHDPDVKALLCMAVVWNVPLACNRASVDFLISSPLMSQEYPQTLPDYNMYRQRLTNL